MRNLNIIECEKVAGAWSKADDQQLVSTVFLGTIPGAAIGYYVAGAYFQLSGYDILAGSVLGGCVGAIAFPILLYGVGNAIAFTYYTAFPS
jgi:hypothetical protein